MQLDIVADRAADEVDDVVEIAGDLVAGDRLWRALDQALELALLGATVLVQRHEGEYLDIVSELREVDVGAIALDHLAALQRPVARMAGAGGEPSLGGQFQVAHASLLLERAQDLEVDAVDLVRLARGHAVPPAGPRGDRMGDA